MLRKTLMRVFAAASTKLGHPGQAASTHRHTTTRKVKPAGVCALFALVSILVAAVSAPVTPAMAAATPPPPNNVVCPGPSPIVWCFSASDSGGGRTISVSVPQDASNSRCFNVHWWYAGRPFDLVSYARNQATTAPYTVFADATIDVFNCSNFSKILTYKVSAGNNANGYM